MLAEPPRYAEFVEFLNRLASFVDENGANAYWDFEEEFKGSPTELTAVTIHLLANCAIEFDGMAETGISICLQYLFFNANSNHVFALRDDAVPMELRAKLISNLLHLYSDIFAKKCNPVLGHRSGEGNDLQYVCYMFWDVSPLVMKSDFDGIRSSRVVAFGNVMQSILELEHAACLESALHGLGHCHHDAFVKRREHLVDQFFERYKNNKKIRPELLDYARAARRGYVQ